MENTTTRLLTVDEVCAQLRVSRTYVYSLMANGTLENLHVGSNRRLVASSVEDYIQILREKGRLVPA